MGIFNILLNSIAEATEGFGTYNAKAAAQANEISRQAQAAQMAFNQNSADLANSITDQRLLNQYGFNAAQAAMTNQINTGLWERAADWNEAMWEKQAAYNAEQAQINREWQEKMASTQYQRSIKDMEAAGLNPILAVTGGGVGTSVPGGSAASVSGSTMGAASGVMASGGIENGVSASSSNYIGQMEALGGIGGVISNVMSNLSSALKSAADVDMNTDMSVGSATEAVMEWAGDLLGGPELGEAAKKGSSGLNERLKYAYNKEGLWGLIKVMNEFYYDVGKETLNGRSLNNYIKNKWVEKYPFEEMLNSLN